LNFIYKDVNILSPTESDSLYDEAAIIASLSNLLSTRKGELPFNSDYGVTLEDHLFDIIDDVTSLEIFREITESISIYEPRIILDLARTIVTPDVDRGEYTLTIVGRIRGMKDQLFEFEGNLTKAD